MLKAILKKHNGGALATRTFQGWDSESFTQNLQAQTQKHLYKPTIYSNNKRSRNLPKSIKNAAFSGAAGILNNFAKNKISEKPFYFIHIS